VTEERGTTPPVIAVTGEALIDLVAGQDGRITARPGGGPFNTARTISRLGLPTAFLGRLSADRFGRLLRATLDADGVTLAVPEPASVPTTLAVADLDPAGSAQYLFYADGTSVPALDYPDLAAALPAGLAALYAGGVALATEPVATSIARLIASDLPPGALLMVDPNCRPEVITDREGYLARLSVILHRADVVKVSVEDLDYLTLGSTAPAAAAAALLGQGPALVLLTDGPHPARAFLPGEVVSADVPAVAVADTVGAGDAFGGAFLAWWLGNGLVRSDLCRADLVREALGAAVEVAALTCARVGAEPPWLTEVAGRAGWRSGGREARGAGAAHGIGQDDNGAA
jgi:fructokinase